MNSNYRNAIIMAAGTASRFVPLSAERPKGLLEVKGEILIERQIRQLKEAGINDITVVVGYKANMFSYLKDKYGVEIILNEDYNRYNNTSSIIRVLDRLNDTYICSSDNYFPTNVFLEEPVQSYYSALYAQGITSEYCLTTDEKDNIKDVTIGGHDCWYMIGHVYFSTDFSNLFKIILEQEYHNDETKQGYWEDVYIRYINQLPEMRIRKYNEHEIEEFDSIDELRLFDDSYVSDTRSTILKKIAIQMDCQESDMSDFKRIKHDSDSILFSFKMGKNTYIYDGASNLLEKI